MDLLILGELIGLYIYFERRFENDEQMGSTINKGV